MEANAHQTVRLLGPVQVEWATGDPPRFRSQRTMALLGYLVAARRPVARRALGALLWPDEPAADGQANLRRELHNLSRILPGCWQLDHTAVQFQPDAGTQVDVDVLRQLDGEQRWVEAAGWARGEFLEGVYLDDNPEFESWLLGERERWRQRAERALLRAALAEQAGGEVPGAQRYLARLLQLVPWHEEGHRQLMLLLARSGRFTAALKQYDQCRRVLREELGVEPAAETTRLYERIKSAQAMPAASLPIPAAPFVGRDQQLAEISQLLADPGCRLLTLTGIGGIGKTRLALEAAGRHIAADYRQFMHGVAVVPLVGVDAQDLTASVGAALGLAFSGEEPPERHLLRYLADLELLLVVDNYEHLLPETSLLEAILRETTEVKLLVTSRERLGLQEEWLFETEAMPFPPAEGNGRSLAEYDAARLFAQRARRVRRDFSLAAAEEPVAEITRLAQGLPLALELAAAWLATMSPAEVAFEVGRGIDFLKAYERNVPKRHRSLRAVFRASWQRLSQDQQRVLAALSVFRGGFTRQAAAEVARATPAILEELADRSLIRLATADRFEMHELLRQFAAEQLAADPVEAEAAHERYADYFGSFLAEREHRLLETDLQGAVEEIDADIDNIRLAWRWLVAHRKVEVIEPATWSRASYYMMHGRGVEGLDLVEETLAGLGSLGDHIPLEARLHARLRLFESFFLFMIGRLVDARTVLERYLGQLERWGTPQGYGMAVEHLGDILGEMADPDALSYRRKGLAVARAAEIPWLEGFAMARMALGLAFQGGPGAAEEVEQLLSRALAIGEPLDNLNILHMASLAEAQFAEYRGEFERAERAYLRALEVPRRMDHPWGYGLMYSYLGHLYYLQRHFEPAAQYYSQAISFIRRAGARRMEAVWQNLSGDLARATGEPELAARLYNDGLAICRELGLAYFVCQLCCNLGHAHLGRLQTEQAAEAFGQSLAEPEPPDPRLRGMALAGAAGVLAARQEPTRAALMAGAAEARLAATPLKLEPADRQDWERIQAEVRVQLDESSFAAAWAEGQALSTDAAVELALSLI